MTLLSVCQEVADAIGLTRPTSIASSTDQLSRQMLVYARQTLAELSRMDWPTLQTPFEFDTVVGQQKYPIPTDFGRQIGDTMYLSSQYYQLRGSLSSTEWARQRGSFPTNLGRYKFRTYGLPQMIYIQPIPQTVEHITLEYTTTNNVKQANGQLTYQYGLDNDTALLSEELVAEGLNWRIRRAKGLAYEEEFNDYEVNRYQVLAQMLNMGSLPVAYRRMIESPEIPIGYIPENGYGQ